MEPDLSAAAEWVRARLEAELPADLSYHCPSHTIDDVVPAAERLADEESLSARDRVVLLTAAWFHDLGFIVRAEGHEDIGIALAHRELPGHGYQSEEIEAVATLIRATRLPQRPENHLAGLLADADLDVLGRDDFAESNDAHGYAFFVLDEGQARAELDGQVLERLEPGAVFGEMAFFAPNSRRTATIVPETPIRVFSMFGTHFREMQMEMPEVAARIQQLFEERAARVGSAPKPEV